MRNLVFLLVLLALGIGIYGYYHGWYQVTKDQESNNRLDIKVSVDKNKVREDTEKAQEKLKDLTSQAKGKTTEASEKDKPPTDKQ